MNTKSYHSENEFAPVVAAFIIEKGYASFKDIEDMIKNTFELTPEDEVYLPYSQCKRYQKIIQNLQNHQTLEALTDVDIVSVDAQGTAWDAGFAEKSYAEANNIPVMVREIKRTLTFKVRADHHTASLNALAQAHKLLGKPKYHNMELARKETIIVLDNNRYLTEAELLELAQKVLTSHIV